MEVRPTFERRGGPACWRPGRAATRVCFIICQLVGGLQHRRGCSRRFLQTKAHRLQPGGFRRVADRRLCCKNHQILLHPTGKADFCGADLIGKTFNRLVVFVVDSCRCATRPRVGRATLVRSSRGLRFESAAHFAQESPELLGNFFERHSFAKYSRMTRSTGVGMMLCCHRVLSGDD
jgi:hypothetical protein